MRSLGPRGTVRNGPRGGERKLYSAWTKTTSTMPLHRPSTCTAPSPGSIQRLVSYTYKQQEKALPVVSYSTTHPPILDHELSVITRESERKAFS